jgi:hypothetical protein
MNATALKTVLSVLTMAIAPMVVSGQSDSSRLAVSTETASPPNRAQNEPGSPAFNLTIISDGLLDDHKTWWKSYGLISSSGNRVRVRTVRFDDPAQAVAFFEKMQNGAKEVIQPNSTLCLDSAPKTALIAVALNGATQSADGKKHSDAIEYKYLHAANIGYWEISGENLNEVQALSGILEKHGVAIIWTWGHTAAPR